MTKTKPNIMYCHINNSKWTRYFGPMYINVMTIRSILMQDQFFLKQIIMPTLSAVMNIPIQLPNTS